MPKTWNADAVLELARGFQPMCVLAAGAELDIFGLLQSQPQTAEQLSEQIKGNPRATMVLLDALAALGLLTRQEGLYSAAPGVADVLTETGRRSVLAMVRHQANCLRRWSELAGVVKTGRPAERRPSVRGEAADYAAFIEAMDNLARTVADRIIADLPPLKFARLLDVGGLSGSWTIAFLRAYPQCTATLFDLPQVLPQASQRMGAAGLLDRVALVGGDYGNGLLPGGCDLAWVSAIVHQNSRAQNRELFAKIHAALPPGGQVLIRDMLMEPSRTAPVAGALFAVNMLVGTEGGGTFTADELSEDLASAGFPNARILRKDEGMHSILAAARD